MCSVPANANAPEMHFDHVGDCCGRVLTLLMTSGPEASGFLPRPGVHPASADSRAPASQCGRSRLAGLHFSESSTVLLRGCQHDVLDSFIPGS